MADTTQLMAFLAAALVVLVIPGPAVLYIVTRSLTQGYRAGLVSVLGLSVGALVHVGAATVGLSAILLTSAVTFSTVKVLGAAYLVYLGIRVLITPQISDATHIATQRSVRRIFVDGIIVSVLNPKIAVFFLAFLPQFIQPEEGLVSRQVLTLGLIYVGLALITDGSYAILAGAIRRRLGERVLHGTWQQRVTGFLYIGLGLSTAISGRRPS